MNTPNGVKLARLVMASIVLTATAACDRGDRVWSDESGLLKYVPADTPYVFAQGEALPDDYVDKMQPWIGSILAGYQGLLRAELDAAGGNAALDPTERQRTDALLRVATELMTVAGLENAGFTRDSRVVFYGSGLLPVARVTLSDGAKFEATVARIEEAAGAKAPVATSGEHAYRYWDDENVRIAIAVIDNELVLTGSPTALAQRHLSTVLEGLPAENIAASGKLRDIASKYEFGPHYVGFIDVERLTGVFVDDPTGINADLLGLMDYDASDLSPVCKAEIRGLANVAPRLVGGYTRIDAEQIDANAIVELRQDLATGLAGITAPVPGLGTLRAGLMSFGMGLDVGAARDFYAARLNALEADPFECELLSGLADAVSGGREMLNQPVPPQVFDVRGVLLALDEVGSLAALSSGAPPSDLGVRLLVASDNAPGLAAMGAMFSPEVAGLQPDGEPKRINLPVPMPVPLDVYAALTQNALALAVGRGAEARLRELLDAPVAESRPFMAWDIDYRRYYELVDEVMTLGAAVDPASSPPAQVAAARQMMELMSSGPIERGTFDMRFTANGVELPMVMTLAD